MLTEIQKIEKTILISLNLIRLKRHIKLKWSLGLVLLLCPLLYSCVNNQKTYKIGVILYHQFSWREKLANEINYASFNYDNVDITTVSSNNNGKRQENQIDSLIKKNVDLLIISPIPTQGVIEAINRAYDNGIPVVLVDNKALKCRYTAYIGADNMEIGESVGDYIGHMLKNGGKVVEVQGKAGDFSTEERHNGFLKAIASYPMVNIVASPYGDWTYESAKAQVDRIFANEDDIDVIFYHSDGMIDYNLRSHLPNASKQIKIIGVDALSKNPSGIDHVKNGNIAASFVYPTRGDKVLNLAMKILEKRPFKKIETLPTGVVDVENVSTIMQQHVEIDGLDSQIKSMRVRIDKSNSQKRQQLWTSLLLSALVLVLGIYCLTIYRSYRRHRQLRKEIEDQYIEKDAQAKQLLESNERLLQLNQQIEEESRTKLNFFTNVSHEFRTPLTLVAGPLAKLRKDNNLTDIQRRSLLDVANKNLSMLMDLVGDILDFRKVQDGKMELRLEQFDLVKALKDWTDNFRNYALANNISLKLNHDNIRTLWIQADRKKLTSIMVNLLGNALKYTQENGHVTVILEAESENFTIKVKDTGNGIPQESLNRIFDSFYQVPGAQVGSGIGLSLVKSLVELHKGSISVESEVGKGSVFKISIPLSQKREGEVAEIIDNEKLEEQSILNERKVRVLIIDDNKDMCDYVGLVLGDDYNCEKACNGQEGYEKAQQWVPDIVICDVMMPIMDGITCCQKLKTTVATSHIPVILLTARSLDSDYVEGFDNGADAYITKPFSADILTARIENLLANRKILHDVFARNNSKYDIIATPRESDFVRRFQEYIKENLSNSELSVEDIGKHMNLSRAQLYAKIKDLTGEAPVEHIRIARLNKSCELLKATEMSVAEIAYKVGFSAPSYFSKCFKDQYNITPNEYRTKNL